MVRFTDKRATGFRKRSVAWTRREIEASMAKEIAIVLIIHVLHAACLVSRPLQPPFLALAPTPSPRRRPNNTQSMLDHVYEEEATRISAGDKFTTSRANESI